MLKIREFVKGEDEAIWLRIRNASFQEYDDFRPVTMEDMEIWEKSPGFDPSGMYIAELNREPVGRVQAYIDKEREEKKGFVSGLAVVPQCRNQGIGRQLARKALASLTERGMETAQCWVRDTKPACKHLFESLGFEVIRVFSTMRRELNDIPCDIGENPDVQLREMNDGVEDLALLRRLENEAFSEHFNFRPSTLEEWKHECSHPDFDRHGWFFATLEGNPVGHVGTWIDTKFVKFKGIERGWIATIGVLKPYRRKGIGTSLVLRGLEYLRLKGMTEAELGVDDLNQTEAIRLYKKAGFHVIRKELTYQKQLS